MLIEQYSHLVQTHLSEP